MNILELDPQEFEGYFLEGYDERTPKLRAEILEGKGLSSFAEGGIVTLMEN